MHMMRFIHYCVQCSHRPIAKHAWSCKSGRCSVIAHVHHRPTCLVNTACFIFISTQWYSSSICIYSHCLCLTGHRLDWGDSSLRDMDRCIGQGTWHSIPSPVVFPSLVIGQSRHALPIACDPTYAAMSITKQPVLLMSFATCKFCQHNVLRLCGTLMVAGMVRLMCILQHLSFPRWWPNE